MEKNKEIIQNEAQISVKDFIKVCLDLFNYLFTKKWIIIISLFIGIGLGFFYSIKKQKLFLAKTSFVLESAKSGGLGQYTGLASMMGVDISSGGGIFEGDNLLELYKSRKMIESSLLSEIQLQNRSLLLIDLFFQISRNQKDIDKDSILKSINFAKNYEDYSIEKRNKDSVISLVVNTINRDYLKLSKSDNKSSIITVEVKSPDEIFSKKFNEILVSKVNDFYLFTKTLKATSNIMVLQNKVDSIKSVMNESIYSAAVINDVTPNLNPIKQSLKVIPSQKAQISVETNKAILGSLIQNLELTKMNLLKDAPLIQVIDLPILPLEVDQFGKIKGMVIGGIISTFLIVVILILTKLFKELLEEDKIN